MNKVLPPLTDDQKAQCIKDVKFRLDCLMSWDLFVYIQEKYKNQRSVYATGHVLEPVFEVSAVFGRQLLQFLKIKKPKSKDILDEYIGQEDDDVTIDLLYPSMTNLPLNDHLTKSNKLHLVRLIKVANKATAHFTRTPTTNDEFESMKKARLAIYYLLLKYVPDINANEVRWTQRDQYADAIIR
jgi:hypothetical protein